MADKILYSLIESAGHPDFSLLYKKLGLQEQRLFSTRKVMSAIKKQPPDFVVAEFFYGYGNNYAGVNISNLDVMLYSLQKFSPQARVFVLVYKSECQYVDKLNEVFPLAAVLILPVQEAQMESHLLDNL
ncbi:hypothetical protein MNBD_GAMMA25-2032 [hydrothermal vent metagenome]|uniref:Response regulatory domain-containing protein n=1 Tax=hydrothermal vent metagenome TaxID=652676 RepID=A0A3B1BBE2_9ZZZZ